MKYLKVCLTIILVVFILVGTAGCASDSVRSPGGSAGGGGGMGGGGSVLPDGSTEFQFYVGPVLPPLILEVVKGVTVTRDITFDFGGFRNISDGRMDRNFIKITDAYTLTNSTDKDVTVKILYPFISSFLRLNRFLPAITLEGVTIETELKAGVYSGSFSGDGDMTQAYNLEGFKSWEDYLALLSDGEYTRRALGSVQELDQIVTVYEFRNPRVENSGETIAPTLAAHFELDFDRTEVLVFGFNGADWSAENGTMRRSFFVERRGYHSHIPDPYIIVVGDDIRNLNVQGYVDGSCSVKMEGVTVDVVRYEMALGDILANLLNVFMPAIHESYEGNALYSGYTGEIPYAGMLYRAAVELLCDYGSLSDNPAYRYVWAGVEEIFIDMIWMERVFYLMADFDIPVGGSVALYVDMTKPGSSTPPGFGPENAGIYGYDILTQIGSGLVFSSLTTVIKGEEYIEIVRQNLGFDPANGILTVTLDTETPRYYIEVRGT